MNIESKLPMHRRTLLTGAGALAVTGCATTAPAPGQPTTGERISTYTDEELVPAVSDFFGVTVEAAGALIERLFADNGEPTAYIAGEEGSAAISVGARYGRGLLYMKDQEGPPPEVFWQGPSIGFDAGANASRVFMLCYDLYYPDAIYRRIPGVEGSAYLIGGMGVNYLHGDGITVAPIRAGVGLRLGANVGYLSFSRQRNILPF
jgi:hypothetical protein